MEINITNKEKEFLIEIAKDDIISDYGWNSEMAATWVDYVAKKFKGKVRSGIMSSLNEKGIIDTNGETLQLTSRGRTLLDHLSSDEPELLKYK